MPKNKRHRAVLWIGLLILSVGIGEWLLRPKAILRALDPVPPGYFLVDATEIDRKPLFDFTLPIIGHLRYPRWVGAPPDFNAKVSAGLLSVEGPRSPYITSLSASWEIEGHRYEFETTDRTPILCPRAYGEMPVIATLRLGDHPPIRIQLPATGGKAPRARAHTLTLEDGELTCTPTVLSSPQFPIRYALAYSGKSTTFLSIRPQSSAMGFFFQAFPVWPGMRDRYLDVDLNNVRGQLFVVLTMPSKVHRFRVKLGPILKQLNSSATVPPNLKLESLDGIYRADGVVGDIGGQRRVKFFNLTDKTGAMTDNVMQVGDFFLGATISTLRIPQIADMSSSPMPNWRNGQIIEATVFSTMNGYESWEQDFPADFGELE